MKNSKLSLAIVYFLLLLINFNVYSSTQVNPPCGLNYGTAENESSITLQMRYGTTAAAVEAINQAKNSRNTSLGCPEQALSYNPANITEPLLAEIVAIWDTAHASAIPASSRKGEL